MEITPDAVVYWRYGPLALNQTILFTWLVMGLLVLLARLATRRLSDGEKIPRWQNVFEAVILYADGQLDEIVDSKPSSLLPFLGTLFLFIGLANFLSIVPGYVPPTGSLSTTAAFALLVFAAVPGYGIRRKGLLGYLKGYVSPSPWMLPLNLFGEVTRTVAMAVRLFGNVMSGTVMAAVLLVIAPILVPVPMQILGLLTGMVHAYIFVVLAAVFIGAGLEVQEEALAGTPMQGADSWTA
jgi:F-type H+-transporting ATPase subunit a